MLSPKMLLGGLVLFLVALYFGMAALFKFPPFSKKSEDGDECEPKDDKKVEFADKYKIENGNCVVSNCISGYTLSSGLCLENVDQTYVTVKDKRIYIGESGATTTPMSDGTTDTQAKQACSDNPECAAYQLKCGGASGTDGEYSLFTYPGSNWTTEVDRIKNNLHDMPGCVVNYKQ